MPVMTSRLCVFLSLLFAFCAAFPVLTTRAEEVPTKPNVIFILADDLGWNDVGWHGSEIATPHLDRLAGEGAKLNRHYVYSTCSPTRVALISGRYPSRFGVLTPLASTTKMRGEDAHLPLALRDLGYTTHISGKWHIGETPEHRPLNYGFDTTYGYLRGQIDPYTHRYKFGDHVTWHRNDEFVEEPGHVTDLITEEGIRVIRESGDEPFFLYVAHHSPHYPLNEPPQWIEPYRDTIKETWRRHYAAAVTHMDAEIGRLVEALEEAGKAENTLLVFSSDNGGQQSWASNEKQYDGRYPPHYTLGDNQPLRGWKTDLYEGALRVPAFARWPGAIEAGIEVDVPVHICDWAPTLISLAGGGTKESWKLDGRDIGPLLFGGRGEEKVEAGELSSRTLYFRTNQGTAIRDGDWKLILSKSGKTAELFHLAEDPNESEDLAAGQPERVKELREKLLAIQEEDL